MGWETRTRGSRYYIQKQRVGHHVISTYVGGGAAGELAAALDALDRTRRRHQAAAARAHGRDMAPPPELVRYAKALRPIIARALQALGFRQHKRQWRVPMAKKRTAAPETPALAALLSPAERAHALFRQRVLSDAEVKELRAALQAEPDEARRLGDLSKHAAYMLLRPFKSDTPGTTQSLQVAVKQRYNQLRQELAGTHASAVEQMLAQHAALCWLNCSRIELLYANDTGELCTADRLAKWERILTSAQARYLRAFESLARVQRLLHLPAVQVNIATEGGQQVNVTGSVHGAQ